jgi:hypothetical protein
VHQVRVLETQPAGEHARVATTERHPLVGRRLQPVRGVHRADEGREVRQRLLAGQPAQVGGAVVAHGHALPVVAVLHGEHLGCGATRSRPLSTGTQEKTEVEFLFALGFVSSSAHWRAVERRHPAHAARGWARPPCGHFKIQSCCCLGSAFEEALQTLA